MASSYIIKASESKKFFVGDYVNEISSDSLLPNGDSSLRMNEQNFMGSDEEEEIESGCGGPRGIGIPMCTRGMSPPSPMYKKVVSRSDWGSSDRLKALTKAAYSYGTLPRSQVFRQSTASNRIGIAPLNGGGGETPPDIILLKVASEDLAAQITLIDLPIFKAISPEELTSCGWTKKNKRKLAPNIVEFTRRFNHVSFWVEREVLGVSSLKARAETISHFIRVAKRLNELNNFHSQFAVISALQSASIYRLKKTWTAVSKRDKSSYEKMCDLFSDYNNWEKLRAHFNCLKLPMIPYLGLFLTDIVYVDMAHPHFGGLESEQRQLKMNNILRILADYQMSEYPHLEPNLQIQRYLTSVRYIEELQKFVEDDHFKLSLKLEPQAPRDGEAKESPRKPNGNGRGLEGSPRNGGSLVRNGSSSQLKSQGSCKFVPGHRKARSLGTNVLKTGPFTLSGLPLSPPDSRRDSFCSLSVGFEGWTHDHQCANMSGGSRHLLDDSEIDVPCGRGHVCDVMIPGGSEISSDSAGSEGVILETNSGECLIQGPLKRKAVLKDGKKPRVSSWHRYWVQLWEGALVYYRPRSLGSRAQVRSDFKTSPCKIQVLNSCEGKLRIFEPLDPNLNGDTFQISDAASKNVYKFRAASRLLAKTWLSHLNESLSESSKLSLPNDLISFD